MDVALGTTDEEDQYHIAVPGGVGAFIIPTPPKAVASKKPSLTQQNSNQEVVRRLSGRTPKPNLAYFEDEPSRSGDNDCGLGNLEEIGDEDLEINDSQSNLGNALPVLKNFFLRRLEEVLVSLGASGDCTRDWRIFCIKRPGGLVQGLIDVYYFNGKGRKFRSRVEAAVSLGLQPYARQLRQMTMEQLFISACEVRERYLVGQQLYMNGSRCDDIRYENDVIIMTANEEPPPVLETEAMTVVDPLTGESFPVSTPETEAPKESTRVRKEGFFTWGNITILNWGKIVPNPEFHSSTQIFPVGFKCLRQEHDIILDRVVDCQCEIDAISDPTQAPLDVKVPLFRITVSWELGGGKQQVRVYEARSPQQAWQAAMLEQLSDQSNLDPCGLFSTPDECFTRPKTPDTAAASTTTSASLEQDTVEVAAPQFDSAEMKLDEYYEGSDDEERSLRAAIREQRRNYFRVLRNEQSCGRREAAKPRFMIETVDSFVDNALLRIIEGMEGSMECSNYQFLDYRDREAGRKSVLKALAQVHFKGKALEKVLRKQYAGMNMKGSDRSKRRLINDDERKRRFEELEARKRAKTEDKEARIRQMMVEANRKNEVKVKVRDMEKTVRGVKENLLKQVRRRREESRLRVEIMSEKEEAAKLLRISAATAAAATAVTVGEVSEQPATQQLQILQTPFTQPASAPKPSPTNGGMRIDGEVFTQTLELWGFLATFSMPLGLNTIPSIETLAKAFKACDPSYKKLHMQTRNVLRSFDVISGSVGLDPRIPEPEEAAALLDSVGVAMCGLLMRDFYRLMGLEAAEQALGDCVVPLNALTWREIFRMVLIGGCCKEIGMNDIDVSTTLKARGYHTTPETADKKALKIARRRIIFNYSVRDENQEAVFGFNSGLCVRIPAPASQHPDLQWRDVIMSLKDVPSKSAWLVRDLIETAICLCDTTAHPLLCAKLKFSLRKCLSPPIFRAEDASQAKWRALSLLRFSQVDRNGKFLQNANELLVLKALKKAQHFSHGGQMPSSQGDVHEANLASDEASPIVNKSNASGHVGRFLNDSPRGSGVSVAGSDSINDDVDIDDDTFNFGSTASRCCAYDHEVPSSAFSQWARQSRWLTRTARTYEEDDACIKSAVDFGEDDPEASAAAVDADVLAAEEEGAKIKDEVDAKADLDQETLLVEKLSIAMQRCYLVIRDLMNHPHASAFRRPVDPRTVPLYYKIIAQPLCFEDIKKTLVEGGYEDSITKFYCDIILVLENALAYNPENSSLNFSAQKLSLVFERMFLETVLSWDNPVPFADSCLGCRAMESVAGSKYVQCERCDAYYHLSCLDPPLTIHPRTEWYCTSCIEQKGVASVHPNRTAEVIHPEDSDLRGVVVGIESIRQTLRFVVEFGHRRELWSGKKVRRYNVSSLRKFDFSVPHHHAHMTFDDDAGDDEASGSPRSSRPEEDGQSAVCAEAKMVDSESRNGVLAGSHKDDSVDELVGTLPTSTSSLPVTACGRTVIVQPDSSHGLPPSAEGKALPGFTFEKQSDEVVPPILPSGYSYDDFDTVCGLVRGHVGWGMSQNMLPPMLSDTHSIPSRNRGLSDPYFNLFRGAIVAFGPHGDPNDVGSKEWLSVFRAMAQRLVVIPQLVSYAQAIDDEGDATQDVSMDHIIQGTSSYNNLVRPVKCLIGDSIIIGDPPEIPSDYKLLKSPERKEQQAQRSQADLQPLQTARDAIEPSPPSYPQQLSNTVPSGGRDSSMGGSLSMHTKNLKDDIEGSQTLGKKRTRRSTESIEDTMGGHEEPTITQNNKKISSILSRDSPVDDDGDSDADILNPCDYGSSDDEGNETTAARAAFDGDGTGRRSESPTVQLELSPSCLWEEGSAMADDDSRSRASLGDVDGERRTLHSSEKGGAQQLDGETAMLPDWELRRMSRKKGREDGLLTRSLVWEVLKEVDLDGEKDAEGRPVDPDFYSAVFTSVVKACLARPSENLDVSEWSKAWGLQMDDFTRQNAALINKMIERGDSKIERKTKLNVDSHGERPEVLCELCGFSEEYLCSQLVTGQTLQEWEIEQDPTLCSKAIATDKRRRVITDPNGNKVWIPSSVKASEIELRECALCDKEPRNGSITVHECCAEFISVFRQVSMTRARRMEEQKIVTVLSAIGSAKNAPIGTDREGSIYWIFSGTPTLYVCTEVEPAYPASIPEGVLPSFLVSGRKYLAGCLVNGREKDTVYPNNTTADSGRTYVWRAFSSMADVGRLMRWLDLRDPDERLLKRFLLLLFPQALAAATSADNNTSALSTASTPANSFSIGCVGGVGKDNGEEGCKEVDDLFDISLEDSNSETAKLLKNVGLLVGANAAESVVDTVTAAATTADDEDIDDEEDDGSDVEEKPAEPTNCVGSGENAAPLAADRYTNQSSSSSGSAALQRRKAQSVAADAEPGDEGEDEAEWEDDELPVCRHNRSDSLGDMREESSRVSLRAKSPWASTATSRSMAPTTAMSKSGSGCYGRVSKSTIEDVTAQAQFKVGQRVIVSGPSNGILWDGRIVEERNTRRNACNTQTTAPTTFPSNEEEASNGSISNTVKAALMHLFKVRFERWGVQYDSWYRPEELMHPSNNGHHNKEQRRQSRNAYAEESAYRAPEILYSLNAYPYMYLQDRACSFQCRAPLNFSDARTPLAIVKAAMMLVEAALPLGSIDDADDRWGSNFVVAWREAVASSSDATSLMQCQIMLEYGIRTQWYTTTGLKLLSCMPSRLHSLRHATVSLVALRLWCLDQALKYDKVGFQEKVAGGSQKSGKSKGGSSGGSSGSRSKKK